MTDSVRHSLERPGATLRYWAGRGPAPSTSPTLVLLHGAMLDHHAWAPQVTAFQDRFPLVTPDLRGHGESTGRFDYAAAVQDVDALLDVLPDDQIVLIGLSLGGNIAQALAHRGSPKVRAVVISDATCNTAPRHLMEASMSAAAMRWQAAVAGPTFRQQSMAAMSSDPRVQKYALEANGRRSTDEMVDILTSLLSGALEPDSDYRLRVPALLMWGEFDRIGDIASGTRAWARREPLAEHAVIPGAGHLSNLDNPEAFNEVLEEFLRGVVEGLGDAGSADVEAAAERLYARYGARPWQLLPEPTREHFRSLVAAGLDGEGVPIAGGD